MSTWRILATYTKIRTSGPAGQPVYAFAFQNVGRAGAATAQEPPDSVRFPWRRWSTGATFQPAAGTTPLPPVLRPERPPLREGDWTTIERSLQGAYDKFVGTIGREKLFPPIDAAKVGDETDDVTDRTWSGVLATLARTDELLARGLGLVFWLETAEPWDRPPVPVFEGFTVDAPPRSAAGLCTCSYTRATDNERIELVIKLAGDELIWDRNNLGITGGVIGAASQRPAGDLANWRADFPARVAEFLDPLTWWLRVAKTAGGDPGQSLAEGLDILLSRSGLGLHQAPAFRRADGSPDLTHSLGTVAADFLRGIWGDDDDLGTFLREANLPSARRALRRALALRHLLQLHAWDKVESTPPPKNEASYEELRTQVLEVNLDPHQRDFASAQKQLIQAYDNFISNFSARVTRGPATRDELDAALTAIRTAATDDGFLLSQFMSEWDDLLAGPGGQLQARMNQRIGARYVSDLKSRLETQNKSIERALALRYVDGVAGEVWVKVTAQLNRFHENASSARDDQTIATAAVQTALLEMTEALAPRFGVEWKTPALAAMRAQMSAEYCGRVAWALVRNRPLPPFAPAPDDPDPSTRLEVAVPPPLTVTSPAIADGFDDDFSGVIVFARRRDPARVNTSWYCLTAGELRLLLPGQNLSINAHHVRPIPLATAMKIKQSQIDYVDDFIGLDADVDREVADGSGLKNADGAGELAPGLRLVSQRIKTRDVPGRHYTRNVYYDFAFVPVHHSGALPAEFANAANDYGRLTNEAISDAAPWTTISDYLRRVRVGPIRFSPERQQRQPGTELLVPALPPRVRPLARDLQRSEEVAQDIPLLFLTNDDTWSRALHPPSTAIENWTIMARSLLADMDEQAARSLILEAQNHFYATQAARNPQYGLLDDPAVEALRVTAYLRFSLDRGPVREVLGTQVISFADFLSMAKTHHETPPGPQRNIDRWLHRTWCEPLVVHRSRSARKSTFDADGLTLTVAPGTVCELVIQPCVKKEMVGRFADARWFSAPDAKDGYEPTTGQTRLLVEATPLDRQEASAHKSWPRTFMPEPQEVWAALRLRTAIDASTGEKQRLEAVLVPTAGQQRNHKWAFVSSVQLLIQPWRWNGLPPPGAILARTAGLADERPDAEDACFIAEQKEAEILGYGERNTDDSLVRHASVTVVLPPTPEQSTQRREAWNRFKQLLPQDSRTDERAALALRRGADDEEHGLFREPGPLEVDPRYYRVTITVFSRYWSPPVNGRMVGGLPAFRDARVEGLFQDGDLETRFRRWLVPGRRATVLPLPRIKMVVPALQGLPDPAGGPARRRPGFIAIVHDELPSPFLQLCATIAEVKGKVQLAPGEELKDDTVAQTGPDPAYSIRSFLTEPAARTALRRPMYGRPVGLTFEREANSPLFPNTAFYFELGGEAYAAIRQLVETPDEFGLVDLFSLVGFRWVVRPERVMHATPAEFLHGPETLPWPLRLLSGFSHVNVIGESGKAERVDIESISFRSEKGRIHFDTGSERDVRIAPLAPPRGQAKNLPSFEHRLLFVCCHSVVGGFAEAVRVAGIHAISDEGHAQPISGLGADSAREMSPLFGYFVLCEINRVPKHEAFWPPESGDDFVEIFFPGAGDPVDGPDAPPPSDRDAAGMMVRCSAVVFTALAVPSI